MTGARTDIGALLGPVAALLNDRTIIEISANPSGDVFVDRFGAGIQHFGTLEQSKTMRFLRWCATWSQTTITEQTPVFSGRIPGCAHRIEGLIPPIVDAPCFSIRRHLEQVITLEEYIGADEPRALIEQAIVDKQNILIAGATGSGKTTLLNACLSHLGTIAPDTRLITIEDTPEIRTGLANNIAMHTSDHVGMNRLLVSTLRLAPTRIVVGEVREGHVLMTLIKAWNTGHPGGIVTLHANAAEEVPDRLKMLATEVTTADMVPVLMQTTNMIVFVRRGKSRPRITTIAVPRRGKGARFAQEIVYANT